MANATVQRDRQDSVIVPPYRYRVEWSEADGEYVGRCDEFPSLSWPSQSEDAARRGIRQTVAECVAEMERNGQDVPLPTPRP